MSDPETPSGEDDAQRPALGATDIAPIAIEDEMRRSYLDYAMSVIVSRALPDVRDGLKPVHRRILYAMNESGYDWSKAYRKSARIVGEVIGKYHPHGDQAVYDALVRLAQGFSMRLPLIDGQGNFGSLDGDPPAAMRYTEVRLAKPAEALLADIDRDTVDFQENYDASEREPRVLPARFPNLLVNGAGGIAVGMATNIPPHNLGEVIDAALALIEDPSLSIDDLIKIVPGPDFPTGGLIVGRAGIRSAYHTGRGSVLMRARHKIEQLGRDRDVIVISEVPYQVNKATMVERIAELVREKRVEGISALRDESDRDGVRVVIELKREAVTDVVLNQLHRFSSMQVSFGVNMLAIDGGKPELLNLKQVLQSFLAFREEVITRRTRFELNKARDRAHILVGLAITVANVDEVVRLIRASPDPASARRELMSRDWPAHDVESLILLIADPRHLVRSGTYRLSEEQARAILDLRLQRLTALGREEISNELSELKVKIEDYLDILSSRDRVMAIIRDEMVEVRTRFATPRRTEIIESDGEVEDEDLIQQEDMVVTVTSGASGGYIKRVALSAYRAQRRGGRGRSGMATRDEDFVSTVFIANTHTPVLFFSTTGMVYKLKVWRLPLGTPQARGKAMINMLPLDAGEAIAAVMPLPSEADWPRLNVMFATASGNVRRNELGDVANVKSNGKIAMKPDEGDRIVGALICTDQDDVLLATRMAKTIRFSVEEVRVFKGRESTGVRGIRLAKDDEVISLSIIRHVDVAMPEARAYLKQSTAARRAILDDPSEGDIELNAIEVDGEDGSDSAGEGEVSLTTERYADLGAAEQFLLTVSERGFGKRTSAYEYRASGRGGQGYAGMGTNDKTGTLVAAFPVEDGDELMLATDAGQLIRFPVKGVRVAGRATQGVILFRTAEGERVVSAAHLPEASADEAEGEPEGEPGGEGDETPDPNSPEAQDQNPDTLEG